MAKSKDTGVVYQMKISLRDIKPPVWRRLQVKDCTLSQLHDYIQICMGWDGEHLHAFEIGGEQYGEPDPDGMMECEDEGKVKLSRVVNDGIKKFVYTYDFGDNWDHIITVEKEVAVEPGVHYPRCTAGKRACPPEDCGGPWGYGDFLNAIQDPKHPEHEELLEWAGGEFDPERFDMEEINARLR
jgi:hypothetical protein